MSDVAVRLVPWSEPDLEILRRANTPEMKEHLGGPETEEQVLARHQRYLRLDNGQMFRVELAPGGEVAGSIGYWDRQWDGETVYESGWHVFPEFQGRGVATAAARAVIAEARRDGRHRWLHAYPGVDNPPSNAICRKAGFQLVGPVDFEFPPGRPMRSNDWRIDLTA
ncbi:MAG: GNAT family N-acetyltransferase [Hamadaea sp.]|nr:GNAT family N-acetyltransferase [Hamadaea sp.]NUR47742.1 GNAT family N-acetyltransferase [Hamadaea sp.]NUT07830.1 GNAT family N-acetyltransferase [Hamadaea sp.]